MQLENSKPIAVQSETGTKRTNVRWLVVAMLFFMTLINYADRSSISLAGPQMAKDLGLSPVDMGIIFSAFGWAYVMFQLPGGWLLDKFGSRLIYSLSIFFWSLFTLMLLLESIQCFPDRRPAHL
jgi:MFS transporter, ACS family, glucarate transporter